MGIQWKIVSGFLILAVMLAAAGVWSITEMHAMGATIQTALDENYRSIEAGQEMIEALEREDSGVLLLLLGHWQEGRSMIETADSLFTDRLSFARSNLTVEGEQAHLDSIAARYEAYRSLWERPIVDTEREGNIDWYFSRTHDAFLAAKAAVDELVQLNSRTMYDTASVVKGRAHRALMPGIIAVLAALAFSLVFSWFVSIFVTGPIVRITKAVRAFQDEGRPFHADVRSDDEVKQLALSIRDLCQTVERRPPA